MKKLRLTEDDLREGNRQDLGRQLKEYLEYIESDLEQISKDNKIPKITLEMLTLGTCTDFDCYLDLTSLKN